MTGAVYFLFFCSGFSALIYQVVWVRVFGNVFGSTVYSATLVLAVFMLGLGAGSFAAGAWADKRQARSPGTLLGVYGYVELAIAMMGFGVSAILPHLTRLSAELSAYTTDERGWYVLTAGTYGGRFLICVVLLTPITMLMGSTLTLLIRHFVRTNLRLGSARIAALYGVNTLGSASSAFLTDYAIVPLAGIQVAQRLAVSLNLIAGAGALALFAIARMRLHGQDERSAMPELSPAPQERATNADVYRVAVALAATGFAGMGLEIVWFRHFTLLLGPLRAVYSMLLTIVLLGIGMGSLAGTALNRRTPRAVAEWLMAGQALFVMVTLAGMTLPSTGALAESAVAAGQRIDIESAAARRWAEWWFNFTPISLEVFGPALLLGLTFPLANRLVQHDERPVGARAGILYFANTAGAVAGTLTTGFLLLPAVGIQKSVAILATTSWLSVVPILAVARSASPVPVVEHGPRRWRPVAVFAGSTTLFAVALSTWSLLPPRLLLTRALLRPTADERLIALHEGVNEVVAVTEYEGDGRRWLLTNGYPMSATGPVEQRYMRALAHLPLLNMETPDSVLVIGFGVGNTTHAATLYPSVRRVDVAELSRDILGYAGHFKVSNGDVLSNPRVNVFVNDGRQHLQMQPPQSYDLITLEPPPIAHAGVAALYSREFYRLARTRLKPSGFISQWLPAYQVPAATTLAIVRAFLDVFPDTVLLSGAQPNLLLIGANESSNEIDPERLARTLKAAPAVRADLERVDLGTVKELIGTFVASSETLKRAAAGAAAVTDDRPLQEYSVRSLVNFGNAGVPSTIVDLTAVDRWCPRCFVGGRESPAAEGLDVYMGILGRAYMVPTRHPADLSEPASRRIIEQSTYLRLLLRNAANVRNDIGLRLVSQGRLDAAIDQFREALALRPEFTAAEDNLSATLARAGQQAR